MTFIPSPEQQAIFDAVLTTSDNIAIAALAGTGKTTSLVELSRRLPKAGSKIFCAFNKDIVRELESRLDGTGVSARTFHSIGLSALKKHLNVKELSPQGDKYKVLVSEWASNNPDLDSALLTAVEPFDAEERGEKLHHYRKATLSMFVDLLNFVRLKLAGWDDMQALDDIVTGYALDAEIDYDGGIIELVLSNVQKIMKQAEAQTRKLIIDYTDMIYWAVKWDVRFYQFQWVLVDECQDLSPLQREMIARIVYTRGGRIVLVGDPNQAIYAFAGADSDSFSLSVQRWNCKVLPLTMTRRCARVITQHASLLVPSFRCPDDKPRGKVVWLPDETLHKHARIGDMVLSRVKAPLVQACLKLIAENIPATILGADIGKQLVALLEKLTKRKDYTFAGLLECLGAYQNEQVEIAMKKEDEARAEAIRDQCNALKFVIEAYPDATSIDALNENITRLFGDDKPNDQVVTLATIHKSKGLEAGRVFLLAPDKLPLKAKNMTAEERQQEDNLDYVARTRAKTELVYITNEKFLKDNRLPAYAQEDFEDKVWDANATPVEAPELTAVAETLDTFPSFHTHIGDGLNIIGTQRCVYAPNGDAQMMVCRDEANIRLKVNTYHTDGTQSTQLAGSLDETLDLMKAFQPDHNQWRFVYLTEWQEQFPPTQADAEEPDFVTTITAQLTALPSGMGLFAVDGDVKMFVARHIIEKGKFFVETINGDYIQETLSLDEALAKMEAFSPFIPLWNEVSAKDWGFATSKPKTVAERRAEKLAEMKADVTPEPVVTVPDAPVSAVTSPDADSREGVIISSDSYLNTDVHKALVLMGENNVMYTIVKGVKMCVHHQIPDQPYVVQTLYTNGEDNTPVDTIEELLQLMYDFQPKPNEWLFTTADVWRSVALPASTPPFAKTIHQRLNDLNGDYDPDTGLSADGETTTMYITTDLQNNFVVYERDYADQDDVKWSRDYKTKDIVTLISKMQAINSDVTAWQTITWGDWIEMVHEDEAETVDMDALKEEFVDAVRDMVTQMGGVIAGETNTVSLGDQTYAVVPLNEPETPIADALTISEIAKIITLIDRLSGDKATELATKIHQTVTPLLTFVDWTSSNRATVKVAIKRVLREANYAHNDGIEIVSDELADFYQQGTIETPSEDTTILTKANEAGAVVDAILDAAPEPEPTDTPIEAPQPLVDMTTTHTPGTDSWFVAMISKRLIIPESPETLKLANAIYEASVTHLPNIDWVSLKGVAKLKTAIIHVMDKLNYPPPSSGIYRDTVVDDIVLSFEPGQLESSADKPTFSIGESAPTTYTNGKDHSATPTQTVTPPPAPKPTLPLPSTATDTLRALVDQFRAFELVELDLVQQAIEHVRREKTEGAKA